MKQGPTITVVCTTRTCRMHDREQTVPGGVSLSPTVLLTGTLSCTICGGTLEPRAGDRTARDAVSSDDATTGD